MKLAEENGQLLAMIATCGQLLLAHGAETNRVEDTMMRMCRALGVLDAETFATPTGIFLTARPKRGPIQTVVRRVIPDYIRLDVVNEVNDISRRLESGKLDVQQFMKAVENIKNLRVRPYLHLMLGVSAGAFTLLMGGSLADGLVTVIIGTLVSKGFDWLLLRNMSSILCTFFGGVIATIFALLVTRYFAFFNFEKIVVGSMIPLLPGLSLVNAVRDWVHEDLLSGTARAAEAFLIGGALGAGVGITLKLYYVVGGWLT